MCVCVCVYAEVNPKWHSSCDIYLVLKTRLLLLFYGTFQLGRAACQWVPWIGLSLPPSTIDLYPFPTLLLGFWDSNSGLHDCSGKYFMDWNTCPALPRNFYSSVMIASHVHFLEPRKVQKILFGGLLWGPRQSCLGSGPSTISQYHLTHSFATKTPLPKWSLLPAGTMSHGKISSNLFLQRPAAEWAISGSNMKQEASRARDD